MIRGEGHDTGPEDVSDRESVDRDVAVKAEGERERGGPPAGPLNSTLQGLAEAFYWRHFFKYLQNFHEIQTRFI